MPDDKQNGHPPLILDHFLPYRLSVLSNTVSGAIARLYAERFDLTIPEWRVTAVLGGETPLSANQIAARTRMDKVQVSRAVARLIEAKRVTRETDPADRRRGLLRLTRKGAAVYSEIVPLARKAEAQLLSNLSDEELNQLDRLIAKLQSAADAMEPAPEGVSAPGD